MVHQFRDGAVLNILLLFSVCSLWSQRPHTGATEETMIKQVKNVDISSLDYSLPKVTLEFFLQYEGEGAPIKWSAVNCDRLKENPATDHEPDADICVKADIELKDNRSATVVVLPGESHRNTKRQCSISFQGDCHQPRRIDPRYSPVERFTNGVASSLAVASSRATRFFHSCSCGVIASPRRTESPRNDS
jgi:hypothetical protein